jgi:hypothetical protein
MWIPTPVYERLPQFWLLLGLLFMSSGVYLGFEYRLSSAYFFIGALCVVWSAKTLIMRQKFRSQKTLFVSPTSTESDGSAPTTSDEVPGQGDAENAVEEPGQDNPTVRREDSDQN